MKNFLNDSIKILLVEDNPGDALLIKIALKESSYGDAKLCVAETLAETLQFSEENILLVLADLGLPDSDGLDTVRNISKYFPDSALIVLTSLDDEKIALETLREGAQNYLNKNEIDKRVLDKTIRFSLERHLIIQKLKAAIIKHKKAEEEIKKLNKNLEDRVKERTDHLESFSYSISHDLRAPLRAVNNYAKILQDNYTKLFDEEGKRLLGKVLENTIKMNNLIDDLLEFSKCGIKEINRSFIDMAKLTQNILADINKSGKNKATIKIGLLHPVLADYSLISQVMQNLISNAIKYSSKIKNPVIEIKSERNEKELIYSVSDNGAGFNTNYVHKLFGVFQRLHTNKEFEGTGVGLAIVKRIISKHNGRVWAEGELGIGATFYFSLPCQDVKIATS